MSSQTPFFGRSQELQLLDRLWHSTRPELLVLYGRPRVGKTRLLSAWISNASPRVLSWSAAMKPALSSPVPDPLRAFSQAVANFEQPGSSVPADFTYASWEQAFQQVSRLAEKGRLIGITSSTSHARMPFSCWWGSTKPV